MNLTPGLWSFVSCCSEADWTEAIPGHMTLTSSRFLNIDGSSSWAWFGNRLASSSAGMLLPSWNRSLKFRPGSPSICESAYFSVLSYLEKRAQDRYTSTQEILVTVASFCHFSSLYHSENLKPESSPAICFVILLGFSFANHTSNNIVVLQPVEKWINKVNE